jgi:sulfide:quinone oxidoreductase
VALQKGDAVSRVVVLGGGIGGVESAISLCKEGFDVELISDRDFLFIYPLAIWIPTTDKPLDRFSIPLKDIAAAHGFMVTIDEVTAISAGNRSFTTRAGGVCSEFDYLVIALGSDKIIHKGKENALSICGKPEDALQIRGRLNTLMKKGSGKIAIGFGGNPKDPSAVRGGPAFEFLFNVNHLLKKRVLRKNFELTFFAPMTNPGIKLGEKAIRMIYAMFRKLDIRQKIGIKIQEFVPDGVVFEDGSKLKSDLTIFISAGQGHEAIKNSDLLQNEAGFVTVSPSCQVVGFTWLYAVGDAAALEGPEWKAKQGHVAEAMAKTAAHDIALKEGKKGKSKTYLDQVTILCILDTGDGAALVYRNGKRTLLIPMLLMGHWIKRGWGLYYKNSKLKKIPRIPGI